MAALLICQGPRPPGLSLQDQERRSPSARPSRASMGKESVGTTAFAIRVAVRVAVAATVVGVFVGCARGSVRPCIRPGIRRRRCGRRQALAHQSSAHSPMLFPSSRVECVRAHRRRVGNQARGNGSGHDDRDIRRRSRSQRGPRAADDAGSFREQFHPVPDAETNDTPAGSVSVTVACCSAVAGPALDTVTVYVSVPPGPRDPENPFWSATGSLPGPCTSRTGGDPPRSRPRVGDLDRGDTAPRSRLRRKRSSGVSPSWSRPRSQPDRSSRERCRPNRTPRMSPSRRRPSTRGPLSSEKLPASSWLNVNVMPVPLRP